MRSTENHMLLAWDSFSKSARRWIENKGKGGYDKPNGFNFADTKPNPIGWVHDCSKYVDELYTMLDSGEIDEQKATRLCYKIAHTSQLACCRIIYRHCGDNPEAIQTFLDTEPGII